MSDICYDSDYQCEMAWEYCQSASDVDSCTDDLYYSCYTVYGDDTSSSYSATKYTACLSSKACGGSSSCSAAIDSATSSSVAAKDASSSSSRKLKSVSMDAYPYSSGVVIYGEDTINTSYPTYCDHYHLYSFYFNNVTPAGSSDSDLDLDVHGWTMIGFPGMCSYTEWAAIDYPLIEDVDVATTGD